METSESDYAIPPDKKISYEGSWRPEDKAIESAEKQLASEHPDLLKAADDKHKVDPAFKDRDA